MLRKRFSAIATLISRDAIAVLMSLRDPRMPPPAKLATVGLLVYLISPIDIIPDVIPLLGIVDELIILPAGLKWVRDRMPQPLLDEKRQYATRWRPRLITAAIIVGVLFVAFWVTVIVLLFKWL